MRAAMFKGVGRPMEVETIDDPTPEPHTLILKVKNCGICGSDLHMTDAHSIMPLAAGNVMGHEFSGEVVAIGSDWKGRFKEGDRVAAFPYISCGKCPACLSGGAFGMCPEGKGIGLGQSHGGYAELVKIAGTGAHRLPDVVSYEEGALVEPLAVGLHAVDKAQMARGATVLVIGAGPVGLSVMLWARFLGARHVIVSERAAGRREMAAKFGATDMVDPSQPLTEQVMKIAGKGPDIIFECVGVPGLLNQMINEAPVGATILVAGVCQEMDQILPLTAIVKELRLQFVLGYRPPDFDYVIDMIAKDRVEVSQMITDRVTLDQLPSAFEALRKPTTQCKVMLKN
ncbi:MAG: alcohol dehydrogenase catalytic domain-containing protein [Alphaproteobacteria bacterium]|nr:alcohol dehydrogenase catalytic domain-containing protein [Alphaproteobacteria bacterium]